MSRAQSAWLGVPMMWQSRSVTLVVSSSHNRMVWSALPVARVRPSGLNATPLTRC
jgi:hypothetical protein